MAVGSRSTYFCWHCYGPNRHPSGACTSCGRPVERPSGTSYTDELVWALGHPLPGRQMIAAQILGERREAVAEAPLRRLVADADPYLAAQALHSLVLIRGADSLRGELEELARSGAPAVSGVARRALEATT